MKTQVFNIHVEKFWIEDQGSGLKCISCYITQYRYIDCYITSVLKPGLFSSLDPDLHKTVSKNHFLIFSVDFHETQNLCLAQAWDKNNIL